jgi:LAS superfamily LD-carboxypeptidase LdcB
MKKNILKTIFLVTILSIMPKNKLELVDLSERASWLNTKQQVDVRAKEVIEKMILNAELDGLCLVVSSGYRSVEDQEKIKQKYGDLAEEPGKSEHHTGMAVDLQACPMTNGKRDDEAERLELAKPFEELPEYVWLKENAENYGLKQSYTNESWHWSLLK